MFSAQSAVTSNIYNRTPDTEEDCTERVHQHTFEQIIHVLITYIHEQIVEIIQVISRRFSCFFDY